MNSPTPPLPPSPQTSTSPQQGKGEESEKSRYRATLNLPKTAFPMKANLVQNEPASMKRWGADAGLYVRLREARRGKERFVFHDGPPYANGTIHLGHMLNKCLKDFVVRTRSMAGLDCPYIPGWDCHGLPIEHKVMTELVEAGKYDKVRALPDDQRRLAVRRECQKSAEKFIKLQAAQMQRLLTLADYEHPYMTMAKDSEGATLEVLAGLMEQGLVYRALKPVHWSIENETALAEAELEYYDREDISVYVDFEAENPSAVYDAFGLPPEASDEDGAEDPGEEEAEPKRPRTRPSFMIWTTTPWTLPANLAIAVHPEYEYALVRVDGNVTVMAKELVEKVTKAAASEDVKVLATTKGEKLVGLRYRHPFVDLARGESVGSPDFSGTANGVSAVFKVLPAQYVTLEDGTGLVHTAPGHGTEDYQTGKANSLPIYCPVRADGSYDGTVPAVLRGLNIWKANELITQNLRESGHLFYSHTFTHSYPHDWRGKSPVIFRCTEQWFVGVDVPTKRDGASLRELSLRAVSSAESVAFVPEWGRNRMRGMLESRPDWCISRQRAWGLPIPAFFTESDEVFMTPASVRAVAKVVREKGSDVWFTSPAPDLLKHYNASSDPDAPVAVKSGAALKKGPDILDVWFESGSTWNSVMRERGMAWEPSREHPAHTDLYLEGSDQHRGWFQSSLLPSFGVTGVPPFRTVLTHGFMVDKDGKKMSKSLGNTLEVETLLKDFGADVCRWWISSLSYEADIKVDRSYFDVAGESYRKVRNTLRFMLSNLDDYVEGGQSGTRSAPAPTSLEAWVLSKFEALSAAVRGAYESYEFQTAHKLMYDFCNDTLSATYLAAIKDRLYCDKADSARRRQTQAALFHITDGLCRLLAPILCHSADEAYRALHRSDASDARSVHLETYLPPSGVKADPGWDRVFAMLPAVQLSLEKAKAGGIENPLDAGVVLPDADGALSRFDLRDFADLLGVSQVRLDRAAGEPQVLDLRSEPRCERSWKRDGTVKRRSDGGMLSDRDAAAVGVQ
jgi:isoleucyl-tRNA synthetase